MTQPALQVFIDGASRGNPGPAGIGVYAYSSDPTVPLFALGYSFHRYTNNVAEYAALSLALHELLKRKWPGPIHVHADSLLVVKQMNREFRVKDPLLQYWHQLATKLRVQVPCSLTHVRREYNQQADALANKGLDEKIEPPADFEAVWRTIIPRSYWPLARTTAEQKLSQSSLF